MTTPLEQIVTSPFAASWLGRARDGDTFDPDQGRRAAAWAHWALRHLNAYTGVGDRPYIALTLPGTFHDHRGTGIQVKPHLEVSSAILAAPDALFPERLAQAGNGLLFPWWLPTEVVALKRAILGLPRGDIAGIVDALTLHRPALVQAHQQLSLRVARIWDLVQGELVADPLALSDLFRAGFTTPILEAFFPAAEGLGLAIVPEPKFAANEGAWLARRVGVWSVRGHSLETGQFSLGVVTPRLTKSSLFTDLLFNAEQESSAALLVRALQLRLLLARYTSAQELPDATAHTHPRPRAFLKAVPARVGEKIPEASLAAAVLFVQTYPNSDDAWVELTRWAADRGDEQGSRALLTVTGEQFADAHKAVSRAVRRSESPDREDVNMLLPMAWDAASKVIRVTFTKGAESP